MAADFYLQLGGIKGESTDSRHAGWTECMSINWDIQQPKSATASTGGGHTAERAELSEVGIRKLVDLSSPMLAQTCACGKTIPKAKLEMMRADGNGDPIKYFEVELENVLIAHITPSFASGDIAAEGLGPKILEGEMEVHPAEDWRREQRQHGRRLGSGHQSDRLMRTALKLLAAAIPSLAAAQHANVTPWMTGERLVKLLGNVDPATVHLPPPVPFARVR